MWVNSQNLSHFLFISFTLTSITTGSNAILINIVFLFPLAYHKATFCGENEFLSKDNE